MLDRTISNPQHIAKNIFQTPSKKCEKSQKITYNLHINPKNDQNIACAKLQDSKHRRSQRRTFWGDKVWANGSSQISPNLTDLRSACIAATGDTLRGVGFEAFVGVVVGQFGKHLSVRFDILVRTHRVAVLFSVHAVFFGLRFRFLCLIVVAFGLEIDNFV